MLNLQVLKDCPAHVTLSDEASRIDFMVTGVTASGAAVAEIDIIESGDVYYCTGEATCAIQLECSRCLEPYPLDLQGQVEFSLHETGTKMLVDPDELPDTVLIIPPKTTHLDITGPVREALVLELPLKSLCRDDCQGLCPVCGGNRNQTACACSTKETGTRWIGLRDLLKDKQ